MNWRRNVSLRGVQESFGITVDYLYDLETIETNREAFVGEGVVIRSLQIDRLVADSSRRELLPVKPVCTAPPAISVCENYPGGGFCAHPSAEMPDGRPFAID
ncbi:hypothetical protein [Tardiphaga sp. 709]|uniref:hypothetical protein n=1 Tax=Tardiphaga sp. 709 TaxID=3076039 RepID=UPI0039656E13